MISMQNFALNSIINVVFSSLLPIEKYSGKIGIIRKVRDISYKYITFKKLSKTSNYKYKLRSILKNYMRVLLSKKCFTTMENIYN